MINIRNCRSQTGASGLLIILMTAFMILIPLGIGAFELLRYSLVQQELKSVCQAAALAGAVGIATGGGLGAGSGSGVSGLWNQDMQAMAGAYLCFCENSVTGCQFNSAWAVGWNVNNPFSAGAGGATDQVEYFNVRPPTPWNSVPAGTAKVNFVLLKQDGTQTDWDANTPSPASLTPAASLRVDAYYGYTCPILGAMGFGPFTMTATGTGGMPQFDLVFCFDDSGSMDDFTNVTFVNRYWVDYNTLNNILTSNSSSMNAFYTAAGISAANQAAFQSATNSGCIVYEIPTSFAASAASGRSQGQLYYLLGCDTNPNTANGSAVNVQPPMNLNQAILTPYKYFFDANQRNSRVGQPPGNYISSNTPAFSAPDTRNIASPFTDLIVNLNGSAAWDFTGASVTTGGITFQDVAWAVEASRGNLESASVLQTAVNPNYTGTPGVGGDNGFAYVILDDASHTAYPSHFPSGGLGGAEVAYWDYVQNNTDPLAQAITASNQFFQFLNNTANCHFGLVSYSDGIGGSASGPTDTWADGFESGGSTHINGWATDTYPTTGGMGSPPRSNCIGGPYVGSGLTNFPAQSLDSNGGNGTFYQPLFQLNAGFNPNTGTNYDNWNNGYNGYTIGQFMQTGNGAGVQGFTATAGSAPYQITATGSTDLTDAFAEAVRELDPSNNMTRKNAQRVVFIFTDGVPDLDSNSPPGYSGNAFSQCLSDCESVGSQAKGLNIPVCAVGLCKAGASSQMYADQANLLSQIASPGTYAAQGSQWQQVTSASQISGAFQSAIQNLVVLTH